MGAAPASVGVTPGGTVKEGTVLVAAAVLLQDVPHLWLEKGHVHVDGHHLRSAHKQQDRVSPGLVLVLVLVLSLSQPRSEPGPGLYREVRSDGEVLWFDVTQVQFVGEVVLEVPGQVQEAQGYPVVPTPRLPPATVPSTTVTGARRRGRGLRRLVQWKDILVPAVSRREELDGIKVSTRTKDPGHVRRQVLEDPVETGLDEIRPG